MGCHYLNSGRENYRLRTLIIMDKISSNPEEWDFTSYEPEMLEWVWQYEILRELRLYRNKENLTNLCYHDGLVRWYFDNKDIRLGLGDLCLRPWGALDDYEKEQVLKSHSGCNTNSPLYCPAVPGPLESSLVHLGNHFDLNKPEIRSRYKAATRGHLSSLHLFEIRHVQGVDDWKSLEADFRAFLQEQYPELKTKRGKKPDCMPQLIDLACYRLSLELPNEQVVAIINKTYNQWRSVMDSDKVYESKRFTIKAMGDYINAFDWAYAKEFREWATDLDEHLKELRFRLRELTPKHSQ